MQTKLNSKTLQSQPRSTMTPWITLLGDGTRLLSSGFGGRRTMRNHMNAMITSLCQIPASVKSPDPRERPTYKVRMMETQWRSHSAKLFSRVKTISYSCFSTQVKWPRKVLFLKAKRNGNLVSWILRGQSRQVVLCLLNTTKKLKVSLTFMRFKTKKKWLSIWNLKNRKGTPPFLRLKAAVSLVASRTEIQFLSFIKTKSVKIKRALNCSSLKSSTTKRKLHRD